MRLWRYLSGISSLLGAMNFCLSLALSAKARHIFVLTLLFLRDFVPRIIKYGVLSLPYPLWGSGKRYYSRSNSNSNNDNHKLPKNGKDKWKVVLGRGGPNQDSHRLAFEHIKNGKPVTAKIINDILAYCNITITDEILKDLLKAPRLVFNNLDKDETLKTLKDKFGLPFGKIQVPGVYIFIHKTTGAKYVGSSSQLAVRLYGYLKERHKSTGLLVPLLKGGNLSNFILEVIPLNNNYTFWPLRAWEEFIYEQIKLMVNSISVVLWIYHLDCQITIQTPEWFVPEERSVTIIKLESFYYK